MVSLGMSWRAYGMPPSPATPPPLSCCRSPRASNEGRESGRLAGHTNSTTALPPLRTVAATVFKIKSHVLRISELRLSQHAFLWKVSSCGPGLYTRPSDQPLLTYMLTHTHSH